MPPIETESSQVAPSPTGSDVVGEETAAPITDTPSPSVSPSPPPPPGAPQGDLPYLRELHPFVPFAPYPGNPSDCLPLNTNLVSVLKQVSGKEDLNEVYELRLRVIAQEMSLQRLCYLVPNLRELSLDGSRLVSLRDLGCGLANLEVLKVARCGLDSLDGLLGLMSLKELHAGGNRISDISPCSVLPNIGHIDVQGNDVADVSFLGFLAICADLRHLVLAGNPAAHAPGYREAVKRLLPNLASLDGQPWHAVGDDDSDVDADGEDDDDFGGDGLDDWLRGDAGVARETNARETDARETDARETDARETDADADFDRCQRVERLSLEPAKSAMPRSKSSLDLHVRRDTGASNPGPRDRGWRCLSARASLPGDASAGGDSRAHHATDLGQDAVSRMTSGAVLCGSLAQRANRKAFATKPTPGADAESAARGSTFERSPGTRKEAPAAAKDVADVR